MSPAQKLPWPKDDVLCGSKIGRHLDGCPRSGDPERPCGCFSDHGDHRIRCVHGDPKASWVTKPSKTASNREALPTKAWLLTPATARFIMVFWCKGPEER